ncbi:MAG: tRNA (adenosine(37)-N6)-threonylcarbamoyltransferase complex dimerization subunit type 1 TsaB [Gammaproteobacteria bacterium]|nr:tRNA (adenosine(37)-N6)-threonylcarbamoyltransferase complex dimerization subunit type 1 TsaB [Gammaproteobacteria bacterium]
MLLALETSTEACSVALMNGAGEVFSDFKLTPRQHTRYLPLMLEALLQQSGIQRTELSHIAYASGPGAFTGVRIAAATAQGMALGLGIPLVPISTLAVLAQQAVDQHQCEHMLVALDARMSEAYSAVYHHDATSGLVQLEGHEQLVKLDELILHSDLTAVGSGFTARRAAGYSDSQDHPRYEEVYPTAAALIKLAQAAVDRQQTQPPQQADINYIRNQVADKKPGPVVG